MRPPAWVISAAALYEDNPFRILKLPVTASERQVRDRVREEVLKLELDGADPDELHRIRAAETVLDDLPQRLREEVFAPQLAPDVLPLDLDFSDSSAVRSASQQLRARVESGDDLALHDLAVVEHAHAIFAHSDKPQVWQEVLAHWHNTWSADAFWLRVGLRAEGFADPRMSHATAESLRVQIPAIILGPSSIIGAQLVDSGDTAAAAGHIAVMVASGFPTSAVGPARAAVTARVRGSLRDAISDIKARVLDAERSGIAVADALTAAAESARDQVMPPAQVISTVDPDGPDSQVSLELAADFFRLLSVRLHNEADNSATGLMVLRLALQLELPADLRGRLQEDERTLQFHVRFQGAVAAARDGNYSLAIQMAGDARKVVSNPALVAQADQLIDQCRVRQTTQTTRNHTTRSTGVGIPRWVWSIGFLILLALARSAFSGGSTSVSAIATPASATVGPAIFAGRSTAQPFQPPGLKPPSGPTSAPANTARNSLQARLDDLKRQIDQARPEVQRRQSALDSEEADLNAQSQRLQQMQSQYGASGAPPNVVSEYEQLRTQYNDGVDKYNQDLASEKSLVASLNSNVDEYNRLLDQMKRSQ